MFFAHGQIAESEIKFPEDHPIKVLLEQFPGATIRHFGRDGKGFREKFEKGCIPAQSPGRYFLIENGKSLSRR
jgi:hypothetical protein